MDSHGSNSEKCGFNSGTVITHHLEIFGWGGGHASYCVLWECPSELLSSAVLRRDTIEIIHPILVNNIIKWIFILKNNPTKKKNQTYHTFNIKLIPTEAILGRNGEINITKGPRKLWAVVDMFVILIMVKISLMYTYVQTDSTALLKYA